MDFLRERDWMSLDSVPAAAIRLISTPLHEAMIKAHGIQVPRRYD
jgi:hypothetical protein